MKPFIASFVVVIYHIGLQLVFQVIYLPDFGVTSFFDTPWHKYIDLCRVVSLAPNPLILTPLFTIPTYKIRQEVPEERVPLQLGRCVPWASSEDWDDTLCPTSWVFEQIRRCPDNKALAAVEKRLGR